MQRLGRAVLTILPALAVAGPLLAQAPAMPDTAARRQHMDKLSFLVGRWSGPAWAAVRGGQRMDMRQTEHVRYKLGGQILLIEGLGRRLEGGVPADTAFNAVAVVDWQEGKGYIMRSWTLFGTRGEFPLTLTDNGFTWGHDVPGGFVRYTMELTPEGVWHEVGRFSRDGQEWMPVVELTVQREDK